jgi:hypothetical protein
MIYDMKTLSNSELTIKVSPHGAELCSILHDGKEYLWQADPAFWKRHSPVLFPIVGSVWENEYRHEGVSYALTQHGFARDMDFELMLELEDEVRYRLVDSEETRKKYPFPFCLEIGYRIEGKKLHYIIRRRSPISVCISTLRWWGCGRLRPRMLRLSASSRGTGVVTVPIIRANIRIRTVCSTWRREESLKVGIQLI